MISQADLKAIARGVRLAKAPVEPIAKDPKKALEGVKAAMGLPLDAPDAKVREELEVLFVAANPSHPVHGLDEAEARACRDANCNPHVFLRLKAERAVSR